MIKILFICHGNICRSPMAEFVFRDIVKRENASDHFFIASAATSSEEIGNPVHYGTRNKLRQYGISTDGKYAVKMTRADYDKYDYLIGMEKYNLKNMERITGGDPDKKISRLLDFTDSPKDIADPWYTGNFDLTYDEIKKGCEAYGDQHPRFGFPESANDVEEVTDFFRVLRKEGFFRKEEPLVLSLEVKPWKDEEPDIILANTKRVIRRAWAMA